MGSTQGTNPETAAPFSAGGFSHIFPRPAYQNDAVAGYLKALGNTNADAFNASGRAYPDVSTQGVNFPVVLNGKLTSFFGTSASSPTFASMIALLNDELLNAGKSPLGFLNPFLYSKAAGAFTDITSGSNPGCGTKGFPALPGWDPVGLVQLPACVRADPLHRLPGSVHRTSASCSALLWKMLPDETVAVTAGLGKLSRRGSTV